MQAFATVKHFVKVPQTAANLMLKNVSYITFLMLSFCLYRIYLFRKLHVLINFIFIVE